MNYVLAPVFLLHPGDPSRLSLDATSWEHLKRYVAQLELKPADPNIGSAGEVAGRLQMQVRIFGSPTAFRQLLSDDPNVLAFDYPPEMLYGAVVWSVKRLQMLAVDVMRRFDMPSSGERERAFSQRVEAAAQQSLLGLAALTDSLKSFKAWTRRANQELIDAVRADGKDLEAIQERAGGLQHKVSSLEQQIAELGRLASKKHRESLEKDLQHVQLELSQETAAAETRRSALRKLERIATEGHWLQSGLEDLADFLNKVVGFWSATDGLLTNRGPVPSASGRQDAANSWAAIERAAGKFVIEASADVSGD